MKVPSAHGLRSQSSPRPFYQIPTTKPTPVAIVKECRDWLQTVSTCRPLTPQVPGTLRRSGNSCDSDSRPYTAFSSYSQTDFCEGKSTHPSSPQSKGEHFNKLPVNAKNCSLRGPLPDRKLPPILIPLKRKHSTNCAAVSLTALVKCAEDMNSEESGHNINKLLNILNYFLAQNKLSYSNSDAFYCELSTIGNVFQTLKDLLDVLKNQSGFSDPNLRIKCFQTFLKIPNLKHPKLSLKAIELIVKLGANESILTKISKIIYRLAKDADNDIYFVENAHSVDIFTSVLDGFDFNSLAIFSEFNNEKIAKTLEGLLFCCGALKFLVGSSLSGEALAQPCLIQILRHIYESLDNLMFNLHSFPQNDNCDPLLETVCHILLQITEIFCSLSYNGSTDKLKRLLTDTGIFHAILKSVSRFISMGHSLKSKITDIHRMKLNLSGIIAHLSEYGYFYTLITKENESNYYKNILDFVFLNRDSPNIVLRLVKALGNAAARFQSARNVLFSSPGGISKICKMCYRFAALLSTEVQNSQIVNVLVKLTRFIANACIGIDLELLAPSMPEIIQLLLTLSKASSSSEFPIDELLHSSLAGLNNVAFYMDTEEHPELISSQRNVAEECLRLLCEFPDDEDICLSSVRILVNIARSPEGRKAILTQQSANSGHNFPFDRLLTFTESQHDDLVYASLGLLVNLVLEFKLSATFLHKGGLFEMVELLRINTGNDWHMCSLASQVICNSIISANEANIHHSSSPVLEPKTHDELRALLLQLTDERHIDRVVEDEKRNLDSGEKSRGERQIWKSIWKEEFLPVASHLLSLLMKDR